MYACTAAGIRLSIGLLAFGAQASSLSSPIPSTPAGHHLASWLKAFNSGDRKTLEEYLESNATEEFRQKYPSDRQLMDHLYLGRIDLSSIERSSPLQVTALVTAEDTSDLFQITLNAAPDANHPVTAMDWAPPPAPQPSTPRLADIELKSVLQAKLYKWTKEDRFSGSVLVARHGHVVFARAYGYKNREGRAPNTLNTQFRIGSISKAFTAVAILQLVQAGKIKLTDTVGTYLVDLPNRSIADRVTIDQLLAHTGGTGDFFGPEFYERHADLHTLKDYLAIDPQRTLEFQPGTKTEYSNYGYILLGAVIEQTTGESYYDYVRNHIYGPAGMTRSDTLPEDQQFPGRAVGYMKPLGTTAWVSNKDTLPEMGSSAGGSLSTANDLYQFARALLNHKLLSAESTDLLITKKTITGSSGPPLAYGFADFRDPDGSGSFLINGGAEGMNAQLRVYPKSDIVIAVLSNFDLPAADRVVEFIDRRLEH